MFVGSRAFHELKSTRFELRGLVATVVSPLLLCACLGPEDCAIRGGQLPNVADSVKSRLWDPVPAHSATKGGILRDSNRYESLRLQVAAATQRPDLVFIGNSITEYWGTNGKEVWQDEYSRKAMNLGIGGDRTQDILYRLMNGHLGFPPHATPKAVVFLGGTNNIGTNTPTEIAEGIRLNIQLIASRLPASRIILMGIFPRDKNFSGGLNGDTFMVNALIRNFGDDPRVTFLDIGEKFISRNGCIDPGLLYDGLHPGREGYRIWAEAIEDVLSAPDSGA